MPSGWKCRSCKKKQSEHIDNLCPDGSGHNFHSVQSRNRASNSFSKAQVIWNETLILTAMRGGDVTVLIRKPEAGEMLKKMRDMMKLMERQ